MKTLILVTGSRSYTNQDAIDAVFEKIHAWAEHDVVLYHGAAKGADIIAEIEARAREWEVHSFPADWDRYGRAAGHIRNREMAKKAHKHAQSHIRYLKVIAFPNVPDLEHFNRAASPGTYGMLEHIRANYPITPISIYNRDGLKL